MALYSYGLSSYGLYSHGHNYIVMCVACLLRAAQSPVACTWMRGCGMLDVACHVAPGAGERHRDANNILVIITH